MIILIYISQFIIILNPKHTTVINNLNK